MNDLISKAAQLVARSSRIVGFTGAGVSAESGIPTYRGESDGLWKEYDSNIYANINVFKKDPTYFWSFFRDVRYRTLVSSSPNAAHHALAKLEQMGKLHTVITQNIDGLHKEAGNTNVIELHGNTRVIGCLDCEADYDFETIHARIKEQMPPRCDKCGGMLKPRVTFFGEQLPAGAMENAAYACANCDLMIVVGSTLAVFPAASLPMMARRAGAKIIIINLGPTEMNEVADILIDDKAGEVLPLLL
jgi:NAD-dependent deacetylase